MRQQQTAAASSTPARSAQRLPPASLYNSGALFLACGAWSYQPRVVRLIDFVPAFTQSGSIRMPHPEIEMYLQRKSLLPKWMCDASVTRVAIVLIALLVASLPAIAASPGVPLFADSDLGNALAQAVAGLGTDAKQVNASHSAGVVACAPALGATPRLALLSHSSSRAELDRCAQAASAEVHVVE